MLYTHSEIASRLSEFPGWEPGEEGRLYKEFSFKNFSQAMLFANAVGYLAENQDHHPDILIHGYRNLRISVISHDVGGITDRDFQLIRKIEALPR